MAVPISTVVNVVVAMPPVYPSGTGFSTLLFLTKSNFLPISIRAKQYYSTQGVGTDTSSTSEAYRAGVTFFSQNPRPAFFTVGRAVTGPVGGELLGSGNFERDMAKWRALGAGEVLNITVDGTPVVLTGMSFAGAANLNGVAAVIETAMLNPLRGTGILRLAINDTTTDIPLQSASTAQSGDSLKIGDEYMLVTNVTDSMNLVVQRGTRGTTPTGHNVGTPVLIGISGATPGFTFNGSQFFAQSGSTGATSGITVTSSTPLSRMLGLDDGRVTPGIAGAEGVADSLDACEAATSFYGVVLSREFTDAEALEASVWAEANDKLFLHATGDQNAKVATSISDFCAVAQAQAFGRTASAYNDPSGLSDYMEVSALARELAVDFSQPNSTITLMFRQLPGVTPSHINLDNKRVLDAKNANYYTQFGTFPMFATGVMSNGTWIDQRHGLDYLAQHLADAAFAGMPLVNKIPQTDRGMAYLTGLLDVAMQDLVNAGLIAPGTWKGTGIANVVNTGEYLPTGYKIYAALIATQSEADRMARKAPPVTIVCKGAGAIQNIDVYVQFEP